MNIALIGNPNSGKTTLFNLLTGDRQHTGNWHGVTVEKKVGSFKIENTNHYIIDLPGIYSLSNNQKEEKIAKDYIEKEKPDLIINILDATNLERNLFLTLQLREKGLPMIVVLNMMDEVNKKGDILDIEKLSALIVAPVLSISAAKKTGIELLKQKIAEFSQKKEDIPPFRFNCDGCNKCSTVELRYKQIEHIVALCKTAKTTEKQEDLSAKIDKIILNRFLAIPIFLLIMLLIFSLTFSGFIVSLSDGIGYLLDTLLKGFLNNLLMSINSPLWLISLVCDGIIPGIGTVLVFLPQISFLFILLSLLEDSGYMSRAAFVMDKFLAIFGLSGSSFIPLIIGFGCSVPAVLSCRIIPSDRQRRLTLMLTPFISCSARLPVYALFAGIFFKSNQGLIIFALYFLGILVALFSALLFSKTLVKSKENSFVMEIPPYRRPKLRNILLHTLEKVKGFAIKAGTTLLAAAIILWFLNYLTPGFKVAGSANDSILAFIGGFVAPIFTPLGFGNWQAATALLTGIPAKEMIVSTLSVLYNGVGSELETALHASFSPVSAFSFMAFSLLYCPCLSTIIALKKEFNSYKWLSLTLIYAFSVAYSFSFAIYHIGNLIFR